MRRWVFKRFIKPIIDRFRGPKDPPDGSPPTGGSPASETQPAPEPVAEPGPGPIADKEWGPTGAHMIQPRPIPDHQPAPVSSGSIGVPEVLGAGAAAYGAMRAYSGLRAFFTGTALIRGLSANPSTAAIGLVPDIQYLPEALHYAVDCEILDSSSTDCIEWRAWRREQRRFDLML